MKTVIKVVLVICLIFNMSISADATTNDCSINATLLYSGEEAKIATESQKVSFTIKVEGSEEWVVAKCIDGKYLVTGYTSDLTCATSFKFGMNAEEPSALKIEGLRSAGYNFSQDREVPGYNSLRPFVMYVGYVNGVQYEEDLSMCIQLSSFKLPTLYYYPFGLSKTEWYFFVGSCVLCAVSIITLIVLAVHDHRRK